MKVMVRKYDNEFRSNVARNILDGQSISSVSCKIGVNESLIYTAADNEPL